MLAEFGHKNVNLQHQRTETNLSPKRGRARESKRNTLTREQMRIFVSNIEGLQQEHIGAPSCGWTGEGGTLQRLCS